MQIFILRHGQAEPQKTTDEVRQLTDKGRADVVQSAEQSIKELISVQQIWSSPLVRAQQTAAIVRELLSTQGVVVEVHTTDFIVPEAKPEFLFSHLQEITVQSLLLTSHLPFVGEFIDVFCGSEPGFHAMHTSSLACIDYDIAAPSLGRLRWLRHVNG